MPGKLPRESTRDVRESHYDSSHHLVRLDRKTMNRLDWQGPAKDLHPDTMGPYFHLTQLEYPGNEPAVLRMEEGSGLAHYPSGRKAIVVTSHQKNRRFSALIYDDKERSPLLGTFNEWGVGEVVATKKPAPPGQKPVRPTFQVQERTVTILNARGEMNKYPRSSVNRTPGGERLRGQVLAQRPGATASAEPPRMVVNECITLEFQPAKNLTTIEFSSGKVRHIFAVGEVSHYLADLKAQDPTGLSNWKPDGIIGNVRLKTEKKLEDTRQAMFTTAKRLDDHRMDNFTTLKAHNLSESGTLGAHSASHPLGATLKRCETEPLSPKKGFGDTARTLGDTVKTLGATTASGMSRGESATELSRRMKPDLPGGETQKQRDAIREEKAQAASDDSLAVLRAQIADQPGDGWMLDGELLGRVRARNPPYHRDVRAYPGSMHGGGSGSLGGMQLWSGKVVWENDKKLKHPESGLMEWNEPVACPTKPGQAPDDGIDPVLRRIQCDELEEEVRLSRQLLVCVCVCTGIAQSAQAMRVARAGYARLQRKKANVRVIYVDLAEAGAFHSQRRYVNPVVEKYHIKSAPWLLMFMGGECFHSKKMSGTIESLRGYPEISLPPILLVEPLSFYKYDGNGGRPEGSIDDMMEAERTLKQMHRVYTLATTLEDAKKFAINNNPPYGILMISARCTGEQVESIATHMRKRLQDVVVIVMHRPKDPRKITTLNGPWERPERAEPGLKQYAKAVEERERQTIREMAETRRRELGLDAEDPPKKDTSPKKPEAPVQYTATRPIRKSFLDGALAEYECTYRIYDKVGISSRATGESRIKHSKFYQESNTEYPDEASISRKLNFMNTEGTMFPLMRAPTQMSQTSPLDSGTQEETYTNFVDVVEEALFNRR